MLYKNIKTGVTVEVNSEISGNWEIAETPKTAEKGKAQKQTESKAKK